MPLRGSPTALRCTFLVGVPRFCGGILRVFAPCLFSRVAPLSAAAAGRFGICVQRMNLFETSLVQHSSRNHAEPGVRTHQQDPPREQ